MPCRPIKVNEGLSWSEFLDAITPRVSEPQPLGFAEKQEGAARAPPRNSRRLENSTITLESQLGR